MPFCQERKIRGVIIAAGNPDSSAPSANAAVKVERGNADSRRDGLHRPQFTLHDGAVTTTPAQTNPLPPRGDPASAWQRG
ncbi:MAG: hypothetical protein ACP5J4_00385 [Anaerolineae bacterium]